MQCSRCGSTRIRKNGVKQSKQNHICVECSRQFLDPYEPNRTYSEEMKQECLTMYVNGMGLRGIARVNGVHHTTMITWIKQRAEALPNAPEAERIPEVGELDVACFPKGTRNRKRSRGTDSDPSSGKLYL